MRPPEVGAIILATQTEGETAPGFQPTATMRRNG
jgi:hypothetical protein